MPVFISPRGIGGGGGVLGLGPLPNTFGDSSTADRAAAEALRDTQAADATWLALYDSNLSFWIRMVWTAGTVEQRRNGAAWEDVTNVIRGPVGDEGPQGRVNLTIHTNSSATPIPATPVGGIYNIETGVFSPPTGTSFRPVVPATGEEIYFSEARINPIGLSGNVTPLWSPWVARTQLSGGITHVERTADFTGNGTAADPLGAEVTLARMLDLGASPTQTGAMFAYAAPALGYTAGGFLTTGQFVQFEVGTVSSPDDSDVIIRVGTDDYTWSPWAAWRSSSSR